MLKIFITNAGILKKCKSINRLLNKLENSESAELNNAITINAITIVIIVRYDKFLVLKI